MIHVALWQMFVKACEYTSLIKPFVSGVCESPVPKGSKIQHLDVIKFPSDAGYDPDFTSAPEREQREKDDYPQNLGRGQKLRTVNRYPQCGPRNPSPL